MLPPPRPTSSCVPTSHLRHKASGAWVTVAGLVLLRQRPGTAKGVIFLTLEDEDGTCNVIVWKSIYERYRRAVIAGRCLRVSGQLQREGSVTHLIAQRIEDIGWMLDACLREGATGTPALPRRDCSEDASAPNLASS